MQSPPQSREWFEALRQPLLSIAFAMAYLLAAQVGHWLSIEPGHVATFWPPSGLFLMVLTMTPPNRWTAYIAAAAVANIGSDLVNEKSLSFSLAMTSANVLEATLGAWFLSSRARHSFSLASSSDVKRLMFAAVTAPLISAVIPSLAVVGLLAGKFQDVYLVWWLADCVGILVVSPIVWALLTGKALKPLKFWRSLEAIACFGLVIVSTWLIFHRRHDEFAFPFLLMPLLYWPAIRFGTVSVACHIAVMAVIITVATREGSGTFASVLDEPAKRALIVQAFLATISAPFLLLAAMWHQRALEAEELERRIRLRTQELADADRRKDHFLAVLAHELRNPLVPLSHALDMWTSASREPSRLEELRMLMACQVDHMRGLIDDLLDVSRIAGGKILLKRETLDMCEIIHGALRTHQSQAEQAGHVLRVQLPNQPVWVSGDRARLGQIVSNLLNNAIKYTGSEGVIKLRLQATNTSCTVLVEDNGPGIPASDLQRIFELFTQVDQTLERAHGGLGIGLTLVKNLVELHGGDVRAESPGLGCGSCFIVNLPCVVPSEVDMLQSEKNTTNSQADLPERRILVVDDTRAAGRMLGLLLKSLGQQVELCFDGPAALEVALNYQPSLIFLDIAMPGMNGYEVAQQLKANPETSHITLVAMTGFGQESDRQRAFASGFDHHLTKPANLDSLKQVIREPVKG